MKSFIVFSVIVLLCTVSVLGLPKPEKMPDTKEDELLVENCDFPENSPFHWECALFKCNKDRTKVLTIPCPYSPCPYVSIYSQQFPKPYPECCPSTNC